MHLHFSPLHTPVSASILYYEIHDNHRFGELTHNINIYHVNKRIIDLFLFLCHTNVIIQVSDQGC